MLACVLRATTIKVINFSRKQCTPEKSWLRHVHRSCGYDEPAYLIPMLLCGEASTCTQSISNIGPKKHNEIQYPTDSATFPEGAIW